MSLAVAGGLVAPVVRAAAKHPSSSEAAPGSPAPPAVQPGPAAAVAAPAARSDVSPANHYAIQAASFPLNDQTREGRGTDARLDFVTERLQALGYTPWLADLDLKAGGEWRRVLVGEFATLDEATHHAERLRQTKEFADARPIRY
jgi:hypothetical protein